MMQAMICDVLSSMLNYELRHYDPLILRLYIYLLKYPNIVHFYQNYKHWCNLGNGYPDQRCQGRREEEGEKKEKDVWRKEEKV